MKIQSHKDLIEGKKHCEANWNDTCANYITKNGDVITVNTLIRSPWRDTTKVYSINEFDSWRNEILGQAKEGL